MLNLCLMSDIEKTIVFVIYDGFQPLDLFGPYQVFAMANRGELEPIYSLKIASQTGLPVMTDTGLELSVNGAIEDFSDIDTIIVVGGIGVHSACDSKVFVADVKQLAEVARRTCSVCTGAFLLAQAGCLDGRQATTHWKEIPRFQSQFGTVEVLPDPIYVQDGSTWTSAGVTAGIDLALALLEADQGSAVSSMVASHLVVYLRRPGNEPQASALMKIQSSEYVDSGYEGLATTCLNRLSESWTVERMAEECGQTVRTFYRKFHSAFDMTPAVWIENMRVRQASTMLKTSETNQQDIAILCGFTSEEQMRVAFHRRIGKTPGNVRHDELPRRA